MQEQDGRLSVYWWPPWSKAADSLCCPDYGTESSWPDPLSSTITLDGWKHEHMYTSIQIIVPVFKNWWGVGEQDIELGVAFGGGLQGSHWPTAGLESDRSVHLVEES